MSGSGQALLVLIGYLALCAVAAVRHRRRSRSQPMIHADRADAVRILWASQTGSAEQLARQTALRLQGAGRPVDVAPLEQMPWTTAPQGDVLLLVSTTGEGDAPDHVQRFAQTIMASLPDLKGLRFGLLALGDATYTQFCGFGRRLEHWLREAGAAPLFAPVELDRGDPQRLRQWWQHLEAFGAQPTDVVATNDVMPWRLVDRHHLNPGSPGAPLYEVMLRPQRSMPTWSAGDLVEVCLAGETPRTYS
ncbi:MAG: flavodoxin domain-containing protein, partial [Gammaproteobacteria bacterium]|nr:flavodoxin domain-containing protein [Gammaproteobacteria bacterium]